MKSRKVCKSKDDGEKMLHATAVIAGSTSIA